MLQFEHRIDSAALLTGKVLPQFKLILKTFMPFEKELVNQKVKFLIDLADRFSGVYKGVETEIVEI